MKCCSRCEQYVLVGESEKDNRHTRARFHGYQEHISAHRVGGSEDGAVLELLDKVPFNTIAGVCGEEGESMK